MPIDLPDALLASPRRSCCKKVVAEHYLGPPGAQTLSITFEAKDQAAPLFAKMILPRCATLWAGE